MVDIVQLVIVIHATVNVLLRQILGHMCEATIKSHPCFHGNCSFDVQWESLCVVLHNGIECSIQLVFTCRASIQVFNTQGTQDATGM